MTSIYVAGAFVEQHARARPMIAKLTRGRTRDITTTGPKPRATCARADTTGSATVRSQREATCRDGHRRNVRRLRLRRLRRHRLRRRLATHRRRPHQVRQGRFSTASCRPTSSGCSRPTTRARAAAGWSWGRRWRCGNVGAARPRGGRTIVVSGPKWKRTISHGAGAKSLRETSRAGVRRWSASGVA